MTTVPKAPKKQRREPERKDRHDPLGHGEVRLGAVAAALRAVKSEAETPAPPVSRAA